MPKTIPNVGYDDFNNLEKHHNDNFDTSQLLNSSFFYSESVNVLDHSRSFRNSLILREISDFNINESLELPPNKSFGDDVSTTFTTPTFPNPVNNDLTVQKSHSPLTSTSTTSDTFKIKKNEIKTVNISASPSLSALADLLNEKSKRAEKRMKNSLENHSPISEELEEEAHDHDKSRQGDNCEVFSSNSNKNNTYSRTNQNLSPNLIDLNDERPSNSNIFVPNITSTSRNLLPTEQPDFLTTPVVEQKPNNVSNNNSNRNITGTNVLTNQESRNASEEPTSQNTNHHNYSHEQETNDLLEELIEDDNSTLIDESGIIPQNNTNSNWSRVLVHHANSNFRKNNAVSRNNSLLDAGKSLTSVEPNKDISSKSIKKNPIIKPKPINQMKTDDKQEKQKKRRSLFSFFQKKPSKPKTNSQNMIRSVSLQNGHSTLGKKQASPRRIVTTTSSTLEKEAKDTSGIFKTSIENKNKNINKSISTLNTTNDEKECNSDVESKQKYVKQLQELISLPKQRNSQGEPYTRENIRNITPLDVKNALNRENIITDSSSSDNIPTARDLVNELQPPKLLSPSVSDHVSRRDSGEVHFPKFLDEEEIDYITQLERNRSIRSSTKKRSVDTLSIKAQNEGMTIFEPSDVVLATPDLSKSPTSSILKNIGTFDNDGINRDLSLGSIEEKLNELSLAFDEEPEGMFNLNNEALKNHGGYSDSIGEKEDNELMNDIMEFANIINFGDGLNFDLDLNLNTDSLNLSKDQPKTFNPKFMKRENSFEKNDINSGNTNFNDTITFQNSGLGLQFDKEDASVKDSNNDNDTIPIQYSTLGLETPEVIETEDFNNETFSTTDFKNRTEQHMDPNHATIASPHMEEYIAHNYSTIERPISMSFKGLLGNTMDNSLSSLNMDIPNFNGKVKFSSKIILYETYDELEYDRHPDISTCNQLTPQLAQMIKAELNELKREMEVHEDSRCYTQFF